MATISRYIPNTNPKRRQVLFTAKQKKDGPPAANIFTPGTTTRLDTIEPQLIAALNLTDTKQGEAVAATEAKNEDGNMLRKYCSHYFQVLNLAVEREVYDKAVRAFFGLDTETGVLPDMVTDYQAQQAAEKIAAGDAQLVAHSEPAMTNPTAAEVATLLTNFTAKLIAHSTAQDALDNAQEATDALVPEADKVIKKIYDEAEAHFNEEDAESQRANCRLYGVLYISIGNETPVTVLVKNADGTPAEGKAVKLVEAAGKVLVTGANGTVVFNTKVVGDATLEIYADPETLKQRIKSGDIHIVEEVPLKVEITL